MNVIALSRRASKDLRCATLRAVASDFALSMPSLVLPIPLSALRQKEDDLATSPVVGEESFRDRSSPERLSHSSGSSPLEESRRLMRASRQRPSSASELSLPTIMDMTDSLSSASAFSREDPWAAPSSIEPTSCSLPYLLWKSRYLLNSAAMSGSRMYWDIRGIPTGRPMRSCSFRTAERSSHERGVANLYPPGVLSIDMRLPGFTLR